MKLPSLKFSLPFIFLCWCVAAVQTHGLVMLAYPAMWAVVGLFFFGLHVLTRTTAEAPATQATATATPEHVPAADSPTDHHISAPV